MSLDQLFTAQVSCLSTRALKGHRVSVLYNGRWYPSVITAIKSKRGELNQIVIKYDGGGYGETIDKDEILERIHPYAAPSSKSTRKRKAHSSGGSVGTAGEQPRKRASGPRRTSSSPNAAAADAEEKEGCEEEEEEDEDEEEEEEEEEEEGVF